jgi:hypothetical protein
VVIQSLECGLGLFFKRNNLLLT